MSEGGAARPAAPQREGKEMSTARCPRCNIEVGATWRWCLACGYDPDGSAQRVRQAAIEARQREGGWLPVIIVLIGLTIGGAILWRTTPDDSSLPTESPSTAAEVTSWVGFSPPGGGFSVDLPNEPESAPVGAADPSGAPTESYVVAAAGHLFTVTVVDSGPARGAPAAGNAAGRLRAHVDQLASSVSGQVTSADETSVDGAPALDFHIDDAALGQVRGRVVVVGTRLVTAAVSGRELSDELSDHVVESLTVE